ncbi:MAG: CPBP family intramembrane metalloprotease [Oscillospiraceae bacterium]|nr:CPBP family intramembrane metalloprotease [Oscillospiraceae bacterium]
MTNKKLEAKRLVIFLLFAFGISWIPAIIFNKAFGYHDWFETNKMPVLFWIVGFGPALANVITRKLTHEGWHDSMLHFNLKGNIKYYITAIVAVSVISVPQGILATLTIGGGDWSDFGKNLNFAQALTGILTILASAPLMAFNTFGEEFGWRGYMNQKMEPLLGTTGTIIVGGIIWGLWHAVLTVEGHNFGTDYAGYPYLGIICMCIFCTFRGIFLMWLTKKTNSIYPAAIFHAMNNFGGTITNNLFLSGIPEDYSITISQQMILDIPFYAAALIIFALMLRDNKNNRAVKQSIT